MTHIAGAATQMLVDLVPMRRRTGYQTQTQGARMKSRTIIVTASILLAAPMCHAGWVSGVNPKNVRANLSGGSGITFGTTESIANPAACSGSEFYGIAFDTNGHHRNSLSILLTAIAMGRTVSVYVEDNGCYAGRPLVTDVMLQ